MSHRPLPRSLQNYPCLLRTVSLCAIAALLQLPAIARASEAASAVTAPGVSFTAVLQTLSGLALILALFMGTAWLTRRLNNGRLLTSPPGPMKIISTLQVGPRERILLIELADTWLVVGVSPGEMETLHTLEKRELPPDVPAGDNQFSHWLRRFRETSADPRA